MFSTTLMCPKSVQSHLELQIAIKSYQEFSLCLNNIDGEMYIMTHDTSYLIRKIEF